MAGTEMDEANKEIFFLYGSHYSNATIVLNYLFRVEPFGSLHYAFSSGKFDHPDRLFHSIEQSWDSVNTNTADVKELTPEFFYFTDFLSNKNQLELGKRTDDFKVNDILLPKWIETSTNTPEEFVFKMR